MSTFEIPYYHDYITPRLAAHLIKAATPVPGIDGLLEVGRGGGLENKSSLRFLTALYSRVAPHLKKILAQRISDRSFIDARVAATNEFNKRHGRQVTDTDFETIIGLQDSDGRVVIGPRQPGYCSRGGAPVAPIPHYLQGPHVTLFGPPDSAKMAINAMNAYHRKLQGEPEIVGELLRSLDTSPKWGADDEDSKTPLRSDLADAGQNLTDCFNRTLSLKEGTKEYKLADSHLSLPIKRFPGLALPSTFLFYNGNPIPLHLYDFALHLYANHKNKEALVFYVPKLENEEEARYLREVLSTAEEMIKDIEPAYKIGSIRLMIVLENPRAILRTHEIMDELHPYFAGASLGWHDYLGSTARLFKEDSHYRIPVKADPNIVIKYIKASHAMLAEVVGSRGGIKVGGMYGILPSDTDIKSPSFQITLRGYFKDVITQMKRDLTGFWVAHPDFVRLGLAIVAAWKQYIAGNELPLFTLTRELFDDKYRKEIDKFIISPDIAGLDPQDKNYVRALLVADIKESDYIANNHPDEIRYNVFQSLQYLTDWLRGNGCVALPTIIDGVPVRVMDDLATAERSRWEVWHEIRHGRFALADFLRIAHEELRFIRKDLSDDKKIVQVKWTDETAKWYPVAFRIMLKLMTDRDPVEFATELLLPFTVPDVRDALDPVAHLGKIDPGILTLEPWIERWCWYFDKCGSGGFATALADHPCFDAELMRQAVMDFGRERMMEAASFHGDIGETPKTLDHHAAAEQKLVSDDQSDSKTALSKLARQYSEKFGFKFLVSAKGKSSGELLSILRQRFDNSPGQELINANNALAEIALKRASLEPLDDCVSSLRQIAARHNVTGFQIGVSDGAGIQTITGGFASKGQRPVGHRTLFEIASLSKPIATAFAMGYFAGKDIPLTESVNKLFDRTASAFRLTSDSDPRWADLVTIEHLVSHTALNMHYVKGFPGDGSLPPLSDLLFDYARAGYPATKVINDPGKVFSYSGGGFIVLEYLIEQLEKKPIHALLASFLKKSGLEDLTFQARTEPGRDYADGYFDQGTVVPGGRLLFPAFAAGASGTARAVMTFLRSLTESFHNHSSDNGISHETAVRMLHGRDRGCVEFMGCKMGLGIFVAEMGPNRVAIHQGANEGFRALFFYVVEGPDRDKGFTILCNADNKGVLCVAEMARLLIRELRFQGYDFTRTQSAFDFSKLSQEQIVNLGYRDLIFSGLTATLPETITRSSREHFLAAHDILRDASLEFVSNQRFARAENLTHPCEPEFDPTLFGTQGKIMDSWESVRHNESDSDYVILKLRKPSDAAYARISTKFHDGNQAPSVRVSAMIGASDAWVEIVPTLTMSGHAERLVALPQVTRGITKIKVEMFPDGGLTRLALYGDDIPDARKSLFAPPRDSRPVRFPDKIPKSKKPLIIPYCPDEAEVAANFSRARRLGLKIDYASAAYGGRVTRASNEHYGPAAQVINPFPPIHMFDGLESARSREPGHREDVEISLGKMIELSEVHLDFKYFTNNNPRSVNILASVAGTWDVVISNLPVKAFAGNYLVVAIPPGIKTDRLRLETIPDGGVNRIHVYGSQ